MIRTYLPLNEHRHYHVDVVVRACGADRAGAGGGGDFQGYLGLALGVELLVRYAAPLDDALQRAQGQLLPSVMGDDHLSARIIVAPLLMTASLGDEGEAVSFECLDNRVSTESRRPPSHQTGTSTSKTFLSGLSSSELGSR